MHKNGSGGKWDEAVGVEKHAWWRHQMEAFSASQTFARGIHRWPVNSSHKGLWRGALMFFFYLHLNKSLSKQWWGWWFEKLSHSLWRHCNVIIQDMTYVFGAYQFCLRNMNDEQNEIPRWKCHVKCFTQSVDTPYDLLRFISGWPLAWNAKIDSLVSRLQQYYWKFLIHICLGMHEVTRCITIFLSQ